MGELDDPNGDVLGLLADADLCSLWSCCGSPWKDRIRDSTLASKSCGSECGEKSGQGGSKQKGGIEDDVDVVEDSGDDGGWWW